MFGSRQASRPKQNPLIRVVAPFDHRSRRALYAASHEHALKRGTWDGCALNRAGTLLGATVTSYSEAQRAFRSDQQVVMDFIKTWDRLRCTDLERSALLREALLAVGLFPAEEATGTPAADRHAPHTVGSIAT